MYGEAIGAFVRGCDRSSVVGWFDHRSLLWSLGGEWVMGAKVEAQIGHHSEGSEDVVL